MKQVVEICLTSRGKVGLLAQVEDDVGPLPQASIRDVSVRTTVGLEVHSTAVRGTQGPDFIAKPERLAVNELLRGVAAVVRDHYLVDAELARLHEELRAVVQDVEDGLYL